MVLNIVTLLKGYLFYKDTAHDPKQILIVRLNGSALMMIDRDPHIHIVTHVVTKNLQDSQAPPR